MVLKAADVRKNILRGKRVDLTRKCDGHAGVIVTWGLGSFDCTWGTLSKGSRCFIILP